MNPKNTGWEEVRFGDLVVDSAFGPRFSGAHYAEHGNVATLRTTDISEDGRINYDSMPQAVLDESRFSNHFLKKDDLVITRSGRVGTTAVFNEYEKPVLPGAFLIRFRLKSGVNPRFYEYFFNSRAGRERLLSVARGAAQQNINITNVRSLAVPCPPEPIQQRIADLLGAYTDLIESNRKQIQLLEESARLLYREWFIHLRFPGHEHVKVVNGVPEGWERRPLGEVSELHYGKALKKEDRVEGPFPVYGSSGEVGTHQKSLVQGPGIVVGRKGNVGSVYWVYDDFWPIDTVYYVQPERVSFALYYALLNTTFVSSDAAVPGLNRNFAYSRSVLWPEERLRTEFEDFVASISKQISILRKQNRKLAQARDLLLPRLMNGEITA